MLGFFNKKFITVIGFIESNTISLKWVSVSNQEYKVRPEIMNINNNEPLFYPYSILVNKFNGSCKDINNPYAKLFVPDVVKDINIKVFNLMSRTNETRFISWHKTYSCKGRLDANVCNNKHCWNNDLSCRCECKELIDKGKCDDGFIWNPRTCEYECEHLCNFDEYLHYANFKCKRKLSEAKKST